MKWLQSPNIHNGTLITPLTDAPYLYYWSNVAAGNYALTAKAIDNLGGATQSAPVRIKVVANQLPTVSVTATPGKATPPASITLSATAADADGTIARVEFFQGSTLLASVTQPPYRYVWTPVGAGSYTITAKATDNQGGVTVSDAATVEVVADTTQVYYIQADHLKRLMPTNLPTLPAEAAGQHHRNRVKLFVVRSALTVCRLNIE